MQCTGQLTIACTHNTLWAIMLPASNPYMIVEVAKSKRAQIDAAQHLIACGCDAVHAGGACTHTMCLDQRLDPLCSRLPHTTGLARGGVRPILLNGRPMILSLLWHALAAL